VVGVGGLLLGCSGPQRHPEMRADPQILVRKWTRSTHGIFEAGDRGVEFSNAVVMENTLIFGDQTTGLVSLYPGINEIRWTFPIKGGIVSPLMASGGSAYFGGGDGYLYSVDVETGKENWKYNLRNPVISQPTLSHGRLFVTTTDDVVYAFDAGTGKWLWHYRRKTSPSSTIYGASPPLVDGTEVIAGLSDGFLVSLSIEEGQLKWEKKLHFGTRFTDIDAHPVLENGILYIPSYDGNLYALKRDGNAILWRFDAGGSRTVLLENDKVFLPSSDGSIYALQKDNGKKIWKFEMDGGTPTQLVATDKYILVGSSYQYFYVLDKNTGKGLYRFNAGYGSGFRGSPAFDPATQRVYILSGGGNLYTFEIPRQSTKAYPHGRTTPDTFTLK